MSNFAVGIYTDDSAETLCNITDTITEASNWVGVHVTALYKSKHLDGVMRAKGYKLELINMNEEIKTNLGNQKGEQK